MKEQPVTGQPGVGDVDQVAEVLSEEQTLDSNGSGNTIIKMNPATHNRRVRELSQECDRGSIVDKEKVKAIKAAVAAGTYLVDAESIATKLLAIEGELERLHK
jgi:flagellar biosynthesis anti-sigma factor FlgM